jgi:hypothetical protein
MEEVPNFVWKEEELSEKGARASEMEELELSSMGRGR